MKQLIARLRTQLQNVRRGFFESPVVILIEEEAVELRQLLDRLDYLEERALKLETAAVQASVDCRDAGCELIAEKLEDALAALEEKK